MKDQSSETAGVIAPPPVIYSGALALGYVLHRFMPIHLLPRRSGSTARAGDTLDRGWPAAGALGSLDHVRVGNNPEPSHPVVSLVQAAPSALAAIRSTSR